MASSILDRHTQCKTEGMLHRWDVTPKEAIEIQKKLAPLVRIEPLRAKPRRIAGADLAYLAPTRAVAGIVVLDAENLQVLEVATAIAEVKFPYIPGLFSFREAPVILKAWEKLNSEPDVLMLDGQGTAHPRRIGLASHVGVILDRPTIGCAKTYLTGSYQEPAQQAGSYSFLYSGKEVIGAVLRTRSKVQPVFVSPGHRMDLAGAIEVTLSVVSRYRIPEPTRQADLLADQMKRLHERLAG